MPRRRRQGTHNGAESTSVTILYTNQLPNQLVLHGFPTERLAHAVQVGSLTRTSLTISNEAALEMSGEEHPDPQS